MKPEEGGLGLSGCGKIAGDQIVKRHKEIGVVGLLNEPLRSLYNCQSR